MTRFRAALIHLAASALVGATLLTGFWFIWYPAPFFQAIGGLEIFVYLLVVDIILGPVLTLIVFDQRKPSLRFDLAVIITVQLSALAYGTYTLYAGRPVYVAALGHRFDLIQATEIDPQDLAEAGQTLPLWGPKWVGTRRATDADERQRMLLSAMDGRDYGHFPVYHVPLDAAREDLLRDAKPAAQLREFNKERSNEIDQWFSRRGLDSSKLVFVGLRARKHDMAVLLDPSTGSVIGVAPFRPWR